MDMVKASVGCSVKGLVVALGVVDITVRFSSISSGFARAQEPPSRCDGRDSALDINPAEHHGAHQTTLRSFDTGNTPTDDNDISGQPTAYCLA